MIFAKLETRHSIHRESIEPAFVSLHVEHWKSAQSKVLRPQWLGPDQHLAFWHSEIFEGRNDRACPRTCSDDHLPCVIAASLSCYRYVFVLSLPPGHSFTCMDHRAKFLSRHNVCN